MTPRESSFTLHATTPGGTGTDGGTARAGILSTPHGMIETPIFMPVGTKATVKTVTPDELLAVGAQIILGNTYHLSLRPGAQEIAERGGLHRFMGWPHAILTDSGGFQVFSLGHLRTVTESGVVFQSHIDGSTHEFTPERVIQLEEWLGADIIMPLDVCLGHDVSYDAAKEAMERTVRWAERARLAQTRADHQQLFGIVQGGMFADLRRQSAEQTAAMGFAGLAIGGLSIGESKDVMARLLEATVPYLPADRPRYLMGVGSPEDIYEGVARGIDMFDVVLPTRLARNGAVLTERGRFNITRAEHARSDDPLELGCTCYTCTRFTRAYLHHLFRCEEMLGYRLVTLHNLHFMLALARRVRQSIVRGTFAQERVEFLANYQLPDRTAHEEQRERWQAAARKRG